MTAARTHILRVKPPWRQDENRTRCGRRAGPHMPVAQPTPEMAAAAHEQWKWRFVASRNPGMVPQAARDITPPGGLCVPCWKNLGGYGYQDWRADPLEVLRVDLAIKDGHGREALARELIALANLVAAHPGEFRELLEREAVLTALACIR